MSDFDKDWMKRGARRSLLDHAPAVAVGDATHITPHAQRALPPVRPSTPESSARDRRFRAASARSDAEHQSVRQSLGDRIAELVRSDAEQARRQANPIPALAVEPRRQPKSRPAGNDQQPTVPQVDPAVGYPQADGARQGDATGKSFDSGIRLNTVWSHRRRIALTSVVGAGAGLLLALATPQKFHAETRLLLDPREMQVMAGDSGNQTLSPEAMLTITDGQVRILSSTGLLSKIVDEMELTRDAEFNDRASVGGLSAGIALIRDILTKSDSNAAAGQEALARLRSAVSVTRDPKTFIINVGVDSLDPEKAALIANRIVEIYLDGAGEPQSELMTGTAEQLNTRIDVSRAELEAAETAIERFKVENDIAGELTGEPSILALGDQLAAIRSRKLDIRVKAETLAGADVEDVISGVFSEEFLSPAILDLRSQYSRSKARADALATSLGPLHPQYIAAQASLEARRGEVRGELRRIAAASQAELQRVVQAEQDLAQQMAVARTRSLDKSVDYVALRELERKAAAKRAIYEALLKRSRQASDGKLPVRTARVISQARPPNDPAGFSRELLVAVGALAGMLAALAAALAAGATGRIRNPRPSVLPQPRIQPQPLAFDPPVQSAPPPAAANDKPLPSVPRRSAGDDAGHDDVPRGINAEELALIHTEIMRAAAFAAREAASVAAHPDREAENDDAEAVPVAAARSVAPPVRHPASMPAANANASPAVPVGEPQSVWNPSSMAPPTPERARSQSQPQTCPHLHHNDEQSLPLAATFHPEYQQPLTAAVMPQSASPQPQPQSCQGMPGGQHMPLQFAPQGFWPQFQPGWMGPQGFVPQPQQWAPHHAGPQTMPQHPSVWPWPHPAFYWPVPVPAGAADLRAGRSVPATDIPDPQMAATQSQPQPVVSAGNVQAFDDIRRDLERLRSKMVAGADRRSA